MPSGAITSNSSVQTTVPEATIQSVQMCLEALDCPNKEECLADDTGSSVGLVREVTSLAELECHVQHCKTLAVVKYYQQNCRLCRALKPKFEQWALDYRGQAEFFAVDLRTGREIFRAHKVQLAPFVSIFVGKAGKVYGMSCGAKGGGATQVKADIAAHLEPARLAALHAVRPPWAQEPVRRFVNLVSFLRALGSQDKVGGGGAAAEEGKAAVATLPEAQLVELKWLFSWLDREGSGVISLADCVCATRVLSGSDVEGRGGMAAEGLREGRGAPPIAPPRLEMYRICRTDVALDEALRRAAAADYCRETGTRAEGLSRVAFLRLMARHEACERQKHSPAGLPGVAICAAHFALCPNGAESVPRAHAVDVLQAMMDDRSEALRLGQALAAFEDDGSGSVSLKSFGRMAG